MTTNTPFHVWLYSKENYDRGLQLCETHKSEEIIPTLLKYWEILDKREKMVWIKKTKMLNEYWIQTNTIKRCNNYYNNNTIVAKCKHDNMWYMSDDNYGKGMIIEGEWPSKQSVELPGFNVGIKVRWTDEGLRLSFKIVK